MKPWKVSPKIGLKGFSMSKYKTLLVKAKAMQFLKRSIGVALQDFR